METGAIGTNWTPVAPISDLAEAKAILVTVGDTDVLLYRAGSRVFAIGNRCAHQGAPLHRGRVQSFGEILAVTCPAHGSMFRLNDGTVMRGPAMSPVTAYETRESGDRSRSVLGPTDRHVALRSPA